MDRATPRSWHRVGEPQTQSGTRTWTGPLGTRDTIEDPELSIRKLKVGGRERAARASPNREIVS